MAARVLALAGGSARRQLLLFDAGSCLKTALHQDVLLINMRRHTNLRQNGYIIFAFNSTAKRMVCNSVSAIQIALAPCLKLFMRGAAWRQAFVPSCKASRADQVGHNHARLVYIRDFVCMCPDEGAYLVNEKLLDGIFQISHSIIQPERFFKNPKA